MAAAEELMSAGAELSDSLGRTLRGRAVLFQEHEFTTGRGLRYGSFWLDADSGQLEWPGIETMTRLRFDAGPNLKVMITSTEPEWDHLRGFALRLQFIDSQNVRAE